MVESSICMTMPEKGETFTHRDDDGTLRTFAVCLMNEFVGKHAHECPLIRKKQIPITPEAIQHICKNMGIEADRLDRLCDPYLSRPILGICWPQIERVAGFTVIDGNHRIIKHWEMGIKFIEVWLFHPKIWEQFLLDIPIEIQVEKLTAPSGMIEAERERMKKQEQANG